MDWAIRHNELGFYLKEVIYPSDIQDCKFMICNELSHDRNGNVSYTMDIKPLTEQKYLEIDGWKLIELDFPGNWFGQTGRCKLEDPYGERESFYVTRQASYKNNRNNMLKMALNGCEYIIKENHSIEYYKFINKHIYASAYSLKSLQDLIVTIQEYIKEYEVLTNKILEVNDEKTDYYLQKMKVAFIEGIKKYHSFDIEKVEGLNKEEDKQ